LLTRAPTSCLRRSSAQFLAERRYLKNVTADTIDLYETAFKAFRRTLNDDAPSISEASLHTRREDAAAQREAGLGEHLHQSAECVLPVAASGRHHRHRLELPLLKLEKRILATLTDDQMATLLRRKPKGFVASRLHALVAFVLDTGVRIEEALTARASNLDYDNLLVTVFGNGRKERRIPFLFELRKVLFRYARERSAQCPRCELLFPSRAGTVEVVGRELLWTVSLP
jgi:integrase/recombinase XerD